MNEPKWYYFNGNNETIGPFSKAVLVELSQAGQINNETLVFKEGTQAWQPFGAAFTQPPEPEHLPPEPEPLPPEPSPSPVAASVPRYMAHRKKRDVGYKALAGDLVQMAAVSAVHAIDSLNTPERRAADNKKLKGCLMIPVAVIFVAFMSFVIDRATETPQEKQKREEKQKEDEAKEKARKEQAEMQLWKQKQEEEKRTYLRTLIR
jgi:hypothetical protein